MKAQVIVKLKNGVLDPQGTAIQKSLHSLGYDGVASVRQGKTFDVELNTEDAGKAKELLQQVSEKLLANMVIEDYEIKIV
jgi:phosphoribosylformylglycinamidine synthase subunit PurS